MAQILIFIRFKYTTAYFSKNTSNQINEKTLVDLLKYKSIINPSTIYKGIYSLGASCQLTFNFKDMSMIEENN